MFGAKRTWIGFDLDGTLAHDTPFRYDDTVIGTPIEAVASAARRLIAEGKDVRLFTARAYNASPEVLRAMEGWCEKCLGKKIPIQAHKDNELLYFFDDRAQALGPYFKEE